MPPTSTAPTLAGEQAARDEVAHQRLVDRRAGKVERRDLLGQRQPFGLHHFGAALPALPAHPVHPRKADVVLFPAHFPHGTVPFSGDGQRISIAFDVNAPAGA